MNVFDFRERAGSGVDEETEALATRVIGAMIEVHKALKPGLPETVYRNALCYELQLLGISCTAESPIRIHYKGQLVGQGKVDVLVERRLVLELKAVDALNEVHRAQVLTYLQSLDLQLGLLVNFNVLQLRTGLKRVVNTYKNLRA
jgi:GxxExxY protein